MVNIVKLLLFLCCGVTAVECYAEGAPTSVCTSMVPDHGSQSSRASPYKIEVQGGVTSFTPGTTEVQDKGVAQRTKNPTMFISYTW